MKKTFNKKYLFYVMKVFDAQHTQNAKNHLDHIFSEIVLVKETFAEN